MFRIRSAAAAIGGYSLVGDPDAGGGGAGLPEDVDRDAAPGVPVGAEAEPDGIEQSDEAFGDVQRAGFMEGAVIAEGGEVDFEGFAFDQPGFRQIVDDDVGEVGLAGEGAEGGEFGAGEADEVVCVGVGVGDTLQRGRLGGGGGGDVLAEEGEGLDRKSVV